MITLSAALDAHRLDNGRYPTAKAGAARSQMEMLSAALDAYRLDNGRYPTAGPIHQ